MYWPAHYVMWWCMFFSFRPTREAVVCATQLHDLHENEGCTKTTNTSRPKNTAEKNIWDWCLSVMPVWRGPWHWVGQGFIQAPLGGFPPPQHLQFTAKPCETLIFIFWSNPVIFCLQCYRSDNMHLPSASNLLQTIVLEHSISRCNCHECCQAIWRRDWWYACRCRIPNLYRLQRHLATNSLFWCRFHAHLKPKYGLHAFGTTNYCRFGDEFSFVDLIWCQWQPSHIIHTMQMPARFIKADKHGVFHVCDIHTVANVYVIAGIILLLEVKVTVTKCHGRTTSWKQCIADFML